MKSILRFRRTFTGRTIVLSILWLIIANCFNLAYAENSLIPEHNIQVTGANIDEDNISVVYYVDGNGEEASDQNPGTEEQPFQSIAKAVSLAVERTKKGEGVKIVLAPGVYREVIKISHSGQNSDAPLIIEGQKKGEVILKGSVIFKDKWQASGDYYTHPWILGWGVARNVYEGEYDVKIDDIVRRREMIFVNDQPLEQVQNKSELAEGRFFVDDDEKMAYLIPPAGVNMEEIDVEVAIHDKMIDIHDSANIVLRNLDIKHSNPFHPGSSVGIFKCYNILIEDCNISGNNWFGLGIHHTSDVTFNRLTLNNNGGGGIEGSRLKNVLIMDSETSYNNWRGLKGNYYDWDAGGIKLLFAYQVKVLRHIANNNYAPGIWFDSDCRDIIIEDCITNGNDAPGRSIIAGMYLEGSIGPFYVIRSTSTGNLRGINIASSNDVYISDSIIADNRGCQINIFNNWGHGRTFTGWESGEDVTSYAIDTIIENSIISAPVDTVNPIFDYDYNDPGAYTRWYKSLKTSNVSYYHPNPEEAFLMADVRSKGDLADWQEMTGLDKDAVWVMAPPSNLTAVVENNDVILSWSQSPGAAVGYKVFRNNEEIGDTDKETFQDKTEQGKRYSYIVRAYDSQGNLSSGTNTVILGSNEPDNNQQNNTEPDITDNIGSVREPEPAVGKETVNTRNIIIALIVLISLILIGTLVWYFWPKKL